MADGEIIISAYKGVPVVTAFIDNKMEYISFVRESNLGNIYIGKVDHIVKNLDAAFIRYEENKIGYLPLNRINPEAVTSREFIASDNLKNGDEVIVQVETEAIKTKKERLTTSFSVSGSFSVLTLGRSGVGASLKLSDSFRKRLAHIVNTSCKNLDRNVPFGVIIRTKAGELSSLDDNELSKVIMDDIQDNISKLSEILKQGRMRTLYSKLYNGQGDGEESDMDYHIDKARKFLCERGILEPRLINDEGIHGITSKIDALTSNKVWLKSGAYLIIEQLESFNAIDVNSGKAIKGKDNISKAVNFEAANEIMRQIRLRNLTGMILIDFINMKDKNNYDELIEVMNKLFRMDTVHTSFIDITGLGIMEITRNKNDKSLREILQNINNSIDI